MKPFREKSLNGQPPVVLPGMPNERPTMTTTHPWPYPCCTHCGTMCDPQRAGHWAPCWLCERTNPMQLVNCPACDRGDHSGHTQWASQTAREWIACCCAECEQPAPPLLIDPRLTSQDDRLYDTGGLIVVGLCFAAIVGLVAFGFYRVFWGNW